MTFTDEQIVQMNTPLIYKIANQFYNVDKEDLFQEGAIAVLVAYKKYKKDATVKFSTYAYPYIFGAMYAFVNKENHKIKVSKDVLKEYKKIEQTRYFLAQTLNKVPTYEEVAVYLEKDKSWVEQIVSSATIIMTSLDSNEENERSMYESIPNEDVISIDDQIILKDGLNSLNEEEKQILIYRYIHNFTQQEVARKLNKTQVMISRYEKKSLDKIKTYIDN